MAEPDPRPRPQYGEYAPPGYVSPVQLPSDEPAEPDLATMAPPTGRRAERPAPGTTVAAGAAGLAKPVPAWDRAVTRILLLVGFAGALIGWMTGSTLSESLATALGQYGIDPSPMPEWLDAAGTALALSHALLYLLAVGLTIALRSRGRAAYWAPLAAGIVAAIIFWSIMTAAMGPYVEQLQPPM